MFFEKDEEEIDMQETMKKTKSNGVMTQQEYSSWIAALMKKTFLTKNEVGKTSKTSSSVSVLLITGFS
ncbi:hypothetical protein HMPREF3192_00875 [Atopobium deltae]|uniref:Uncharacterized protein n=1 Tax=Atopobium deltae TaxID=1393034 RepID=A0A133XU33_9ACTN|nr:hypothetical protein HMPREF3192_00875 [Atopobium deltae]